MNVGYRRNWLLPPPLPWLRKWLNNFCFLLLKTIFSVDTKEPVVPADTWTHVCVTYDSRKSKAEIYVNGMLKKSEGGGTGSLSQVKTRLRSIQCFHLTSQRPYWCLKTIKWRPSWYPKWVRLNFSSVLIQTFPIVLALQYGRRSREWRHYIFYQQKYFKIICNIYKKKCFFLGLERQSGYW